MTTLLDCTVWTLMIAAVLLLFANAPATDADFIAARRAMQERLQRTLRAIAKWGRGRAGR